MDDDYTSFEDYLSNEVHATDPDIFDGRKDDPSSSVNVILPEESTEQFVFLYTYTVAIVALGVILNLVLIKGIIGTKSGGALVFVLQIAIADVLALLTSDWELLYLLKRTWTFPAEQCALYNGLESFTSVAIAYFIVGLNFHSISSYNLAVDLAKKVLANPDAESATESLTEENNYEVATDTSSQKRSLTIDYRYKKRRISVLFPILLVWFIAASEALPLFLFSDIIVATVAGGDGQQAGHYCTVLVNAVTNHHIVDLMVIAIRIILPTVALLITLIQTVVKFYKGKCFTQPDEMDENVAFALKLSIFLTVSYAIFTVQRLYGSLLQEILAGPNVVPKYPIFNSTVGLGLAVLHYSASFFRPLLLIFMCKQKNNHVDITFTCQRRLENNAISLQG